ncbi:hypothetical protein [Bacillus phage SDFMU_Pbc]|uniref:Uncharacterized protein n=1 Tax=Bacillus phage SDFMU_Pbc TaxID=3076135 RepID=A0AA96KR18_9CAUD|nr:hypothetical protein [Bacillus phage SDFMU_Pbc]
MTTTRDKTLSAIEKYLLRNLEETMDYIDTVYHYDGSLQDVQAYRNTEEVIDELFNKPSEVIKAIRDEEFKPDLPYFYFEGNKLCSTSARNQELTIQNNITEIALTLVEYSNVLLDFNFTDELRSLVKDIKI